MSVSIDLHFFLLVVFVTPFDSLTFKPDALSLRTAWSYEYSNSVLFSIPPRTFVASAVWLELDSIAFSLIVHEVSLVYSAIKPSEGTFTVHHVVDPVAFVGSSVGPAHLAVALNFVVLPVALVDVLVRPFVDSIAVLHAVVVRSNVLRSVNVVFFALAVVRIVFKLAFVLRAIYMEVLTVSVSHIFHEFPSVQVTLSVPEGPFALSSVVVPVTFIMGSI